MSVDFSRFDLYNPTEEHEMLRRMVREFTQGEIEPQAMECDRTEAFNLPLFRRLGELGLLGITVSEEHGGTGMDAVATVIVHEELSASDPGFCLAYLAHTLLFVNNFYRNSNDEQRDRILAKVISGEWVGGMCMSEPAVGTDVLGMQTSATRDGDIYRLNGQKIKDKCGMRASTTAELVFEDCEVPVANRLGQEGDSMLHMMRNLEIERLGLAAMSLGIGMRCLQVMCRYANEREAFGKPIREFGQIQRYIARSYASWKAARAYVYDTARRMDLENPNNRIDSDGVKLVATAMAKEVADNAMQVLGGYGYVGEYVVERLWRDAKLLEIGGGTLEAHEKNIAKDLSRSFEQVIV